MAFKAVVRDGDPARIAMAGLPVVASLGIPGENGAMVLKE